MNKPAIHELMQLFNEEFQEYTYHTNMAKFTFKNLTTGQSARLFAIIMKYSLRCELEYGELVVWVN